jgi:hypothetical protein
LRRLCIGQKDLQEASRQGTKNLRGRQLTVIGAIPTSTILRSVTASSIIVAAASIWARVPEVTLSGILAFQQPVRAILASGAEILSAFDLLGW